MEEKINQGASTEIVPLNSSERLLISQWKEKCQKFNIPLFLKEGEKGFEIDFQNNRGTNEEKLNLLAAFLSKSTGSVDCVFALSLLQQHLSVAVSGDDTKRLTSQSNAHIQTLASLNPQDEVEGMLLTQILSLQSLGMRCMSIAANPENSTVNVDRNVNNLTKLLRLQHEAIETLNKHRRKGTQQLLVQHVNVNQGGQAIVGAVQQGGGGKCKNEGSTP